MFPPKLKSSNAVFPVALVVSQFAPAGVAAVETQVLGFLVRGSRV